jgi:TIR domain
MLMDDAAREHLFVSYATEDVALAEWLTRKLTADGYRVWCDRFRLLGGESYPRDIDIAIKTRTFRVLALLSRASLHKPNPRKERTIALSIGRERNEDFLIPLNVSGLRATELDWMTSDLTFIPFSQGWPAGFRQLLEKLASINAPRPLQGGREIAASTFLSGDVLRHAPEPLYSNIFRVVKMPEVLLRFTVAPGISGPERDAVLAMWPFYSVSPALVYAFDNPSPTALEGRVVTFEGQVPWVGVFDINGVRVRNIVASLLKVSVAARAVALGLRPTPNGRAMYFPWGLLEKDRLRFHGYSGNETSITVTSERTLWRPAKSEKYRYYLAADTRARSDIPPGYVVQITPTIHVTSPVGEVLLGRTINSRRKHVSKTWTNHEWTNRLFAVAEFLAGGTDAIRFGSTPETEMVVSARPITLAAQVGINEAMLDMAEPAEEEQSGYDDAIYDQGEDDDDE